MTDRILKCPKTAFIGFYLELEKHNSDFKIYGKLPSILASVITLTSILVLTGTFFNNSPAYAVSSTITGVHDGNNRDIFTGGTCIASTAPPPPSCMASSTTGGSHSTTWVGQSTSSTRINDITFAMSDNNIVQSYACRLENSNVPGSSCVRLTGTLGSSSTVTARFSYSNLAVTTHNFCAIPTDNGGHTATSCFRWTITAPTTTTTTTPPTTTTTTNPSIRINNVIDGQQDSIIRTGHTTSDTINMVAFSVNPPSSNLVNFECAISRSDDMAPPSYHSCRVSGGSTLDRFTVPAPSSAGAYLSIQDYRLCLRATVTPSYTVTQPGCFTYTRYIPVTTSPDTEIITHTADSGCSRTGNPPLYTCTDVDPLLEGSPPTTLDRNVMWVFSATPSHLPGADPPYARALFECRWDHQDFYSPCGPGIGILPILGVCIHRAVGPPCPEVSPYIILVPYWGTDRIEGVSPGRHQVSVKSYYLNSADGPPVDFSWCVRPCDSNQFTEIEHGRTGIPLSGGGMTIEQNQTLPSLYLVTDLGRDQVVPENKEVTLNANTSILSMSEIPVNDTAKAGYYKILKDAIRDLPLSYSIIQTGGPMVKLEPVASNNNSGGPSVRFLAPSVNIDTKLTFNLIVTDNKSHHHITSDTINVILKTAVGMTNTTEVNTGTNKTNNAGSGTATPTVLPGLPKKNNVPIANAGTDQKVESGKQVTLDGSKSYDPDSDKLIYNWKQTNGNSKIVIDNPNAISPSFVAPDVDKDTNIGLELSVDDGNGGKSTDDVKITVMASEQAKVGSGDGGGSNSIGSTGSDTGTSSSSSSDDKVQKPSDSDAQTIQGEREDTPPG